MSLIIMLLVLLLACVICVYIINMLPLDGPIKQVALLIVGIVFLIMVLAIILPLVGVELPARIGN